VTGFVQQVPHASASNVSTLTSSAFPGAITVGNLLIVTANFWVDHTISSPATITDANGNTWNNDTSAPAAGDSESQISSAFVASGKGGTGDTVTHNGGGFGSGAYIEMDCCEFNMGSVLASVPIDSAASNATAGGNNTGSISVATAVATAQANELIIACLNNNTDANPGGITDPCNINSSQTGVTSIGVQQITNSTVGYEASFYPATSAATYTANWAFNVSVDGGSCGACIAAYKYSGTWGGGGAPPTSAEIRVRDRPPSRLGTPTSLFRSPILDTGTTPPPFIDQTAGPRPLSLRIGTPLSKLRSGILDTGTTSPPFIDQTAGNRPRFLWLGTPVSKIRSGILDTGTTPPPFIDQTAGISPKTLRLGTPLSQLRSGILDTGTTLIPFVDQSAGQPARMSWIGTPFSKFRGVVNTVPGSTTQSYSYTASGGILLGGTGLPLRYEDYLPSGGLILGGSAPVSFVSNDGARTGGLILGGSSPDLRVADWTPAGGIILGGTGPRNYVCDEPLPSGGLVIGGSAGYSTHVSTLTWVASGGVILGGSAPVSFFHAGGGGLLQRVRKWSSVKDTYTQ
jgi:hypothetical protein